MKIITLYVNFLLQPGIKYAITGLSDAGDYFAINEDSGIISLKKDLKTDPSKRPSFEVGENHNTN